MSQTGVDGIERWSLTVSDGVMLAGDIGGPIGAQTVILLHGGAQTRHSWGGAMQELVARGFRVLNYDARGHGDSAWAGEGQYGFLRMAADLGEAAATIGGAPILIGASMGGMSSLFYGGDGGACSALVLVDIVPRPAREGSNRILNFMLGNREGFATLEDAADVVAAYHPERPRPKDVSGLMKNLRLRADGRLYWHWDPAMMSGPTRMEPPEMASRMLALAENIHVPTLLARGLSSDVVNEEGITELREHMPQLEVFDVAGAGHMVAGDRNEVFLQGILDFFARHDFTGT